jgi:putative hydrolase of the HAD superfamily
MKAVLFDLDDTLVDHQHSFRSGLAALRDAYSPLQGYSFEELETVYIQWLETLHRRVLAGTCTLYEARRERFRHVFQHCGAALSEADLAQVIDLHHHVYRESQRPVAGVVALLAHLRGAGLRIGVVTNNLTEEQWGKLRQCGLESYVDVMVTAEDVGIPKPDPTMFEAVLQQLACAAGDTVMIGDSWRADVLGATALGIRTLWLNRYDQTCPDPALATEFRSYEPLADMLARLGL